MTSLIETLCEGLGYIVVTYRVHPEEGGKFGAECLELGIRTCGDSVGGAFDAIAEVTLDCYPDCISGVMNYARI